MSHLLEDLNEPQRQAVVHTDGPLLVLAGAGSGKTRVITRRAAHLATTVTRPRHILAITFTNKSAGEMRERVEALGVGREMLVCTFHSLGARLLRWYAPDAGLSSNFTIYDESDSKQVLKQAIVDAGLSTANWAPAMVKAKISDAKNRLLTPEKYAEGADDFAETTIARIYSIYQTLLANRQALDFDDLLTKTAFLLGDQPKLRDYLEDRYRYVLIDEYQDTNHAQYMIARGLTLKNENICATGDPDQSIYAWRGADIRNILEFEHDYPKAQVVRLEQNYRSTQRILSAASLLIKNNKKRKHKDLWTDSGAGPRVRVVEREDAEDEADFLSEEIIKHKEAGGSLSDIAVFYRVNSLTRVIEEAFLRAGVSYQIARGTEFYARKEIKDLLAYLRLLVNPADEVALRRAINTPARGIGKTTVDRLASFANANQLAISEAVRRVGEIGEIKKAAAAKVKAFAEMIEKMRTLVEEPAEVVVEEVFKRSDLESSLSKPGTLGSGDDDALDNVAELISAAADFTRMNPEGKLIEWLEQVSLVSDVDGVDSSAGAVTLMTLHAAKGLEFPKVYIVAAEDGLLPHTRYQDDAGDVEEERRLCFVGMTRAKQSLTLSYAKWRMIRGMMTRTTASQFLGELPPDEIEWHRDEPEQSTSSRADFDRQDKGDFGKWRVGMYLRHPSFGVGELLWKQPGGQFTRAAVRFPAYGEKTLILEYAKMKPLDPDECQL